MNCVRSYIDELLLLTLGHLCQAVVAPCQVSLEATQRRDGHALHLATLRSAASRREAEATDAAAGSHARRQHVVLVKHAVGQLVKK